MAEGKRAKKLSKVVEGSIIIITERESGTVLKYDSAELSDVIKGNLALHGLSQKLGDAAAGRSGQDAVDAIGKVWEGLKAGNWSVRVPAAEKITKSKILERYESLPAKEKAVAEGLLKQLGILQ